MTRPSASRRSPQQRPDYAGKIDHGLDKMSAKDLQPGFKPLSSKASLTPRGSRTGEFGLDRRCLPRSTTELHPFQGHPGGFMNWGQFVRFTAIGIGVTLTVVAEIYLAVGATLLDL
jgi:hypothetical protein